MKKFKFAHYLVVLMLLVLAASCGKSLDKVVSTTSQSSTKKYVGSEKCGQCHQSYYSTFIRTGHAWKLRKNGATLNGVDVIADGPYFGLPPIKDAIETQFKLDTNPLTGITYTATTDSKGNALPANYSYTLDEWTDIAYVEGGFRWKTRFVNNDGYIVTGDSTNPNVQQNLRYNVSGSSWTTYNTGQKKPYTCGACHTTGFDPTGTENASMPGLKGSWEFEGIQCERCHGPGSQHVENRESPIIDKSSELCGSCHNRYWEENVWEEDATDTDGSKYTGWKNPTAQGYATWDDYAKASVGDATHLANYTIAASSPFEKHHEQYEDLNSSPHAGKLECTTCHDPHQKAANSIKVKCGECHESTARSVATSTHGKLGYYCPDCHMPFAGKSALGDTTNFKGDIRSHLFMPKWIKDGATTTNSNSTLTTTDLYQNTDFIVSGATAVTLDTDRKAYISWEYMCKRCHKNATAAQFVEFINCTGPHGLNSNVTTCKSTSPSNYVNDVLPDWKFAAVKADQ